MSTMDLAYCDSPSLPVTKGRLFDFPDDPIACMRHLQMQHGNVAAIEEEGRRLYFAFGPEFNRQLLSDSATFHSKFFAICGPRKSSQRRLSSGLLSMNGEEHKRQRRLVMDAFLKKAILNYLPTIRVLTEEMLSTWRAGTERDINRDMTDFMLRLTSTILFGIDDAEMACRIGRMIDQWIHLNHELGMAAFVSEPGVTARYEELLGFASELEGEIAAMIGRRKGCPTGADALSLMLNAHDSQGAITDHEMIGQVALMFCAAHLTTAHTLAWTLFLLAEHPTSMAELHQEYQACLDGGFPSLEQLDRLSVTDRVIKESMRVLPASSYSQRVAAVPTQLGPFSLPAGAGVVFSQFMTHHMPDLFPHPEQFRPDRWLTISPSPYEYLPFGAGPRMCIGAPLAMLILKSVLPTILQRFKLTMVPGSDVSGNVISTMLCPTTSVMMRVDTQDGRFESQPVTGNIHDLVDLREVDHRGLKAA